MSNAAEFSSHTDPVFDRIASRYDGLCDLFSFGIHRIWKRRVARTIASEPWTHCLDLASGTGDIVVRMLERKALSNDHWIIASDISPQMLSIAERKLSDYGQSVSFELVDAHNMNSIESSSIDVVSMSFGLKICDRTKVMRESLRVLKPGGRLVTLEASNIPLGWLHTLYLFYMSLCTPLIAWIATRGDASAYKYLLAGVKEFPAAERIKQEMNEAGFDDVEFQRLSLGIVAIHVARKPLR